MFLDTSDGTQRASVIRATTDSPMSPPPLANITNPLSRNNRHGGSRSLLEILMANQQPTTKKPEFHGRKGDNPAKLYPNLKIENDRGPRGEGGMEVE